MTPTSEQCIADTRRWLERAVIGLNLCPFAKAVHVKGRIHYAVSRASQPRDLLDDLRHELEALMAHVPETRETTLLMAPACLLEFIDFNDFLRMADRLLRKLGLEGVIQLASFHPQYAFAGAEQDDISNYTNRAPYPTLHLLREDRIAQTLAGFAEPQLIYESNIQTLTSLGKVGWAALQVDAGAGTP